MTAMKKRYVAAGAVIVGLGGYFLLRDTSDAAEPKKVSTRDGSMRIDRPHNVETPVARPSTPQRRKPKEKWNPVTKSFEREIMDANPEDELERAQKDELLYKISRLRLSASDAAAPCWKGGDSTEEIHIKYSVIVDKEAVRADNVRVIDNNISDAKTTACIVQSIEDMSTDGDGLPNMTKDFELTMSLHDLYVRNRGAAQQDEDRGTKVNPIESPIDKPTATWPPAK